MFHGARGVPAGGGGRAVASLGMRVQVSTASVVGVVSGALVLVLCACAGVRAEGPPGPAVGQAPARSPPADTPVVRIHVLAVDYRAGGGDAIVVADSSEARPRHVLIDAGDDGSAARALGELAVPSLDLLVLTHAHYDHYGGMDEVLDAVPVRTFAFGGQVRTAVTYRRLLERVREEVPRIIVVDSPRVVRLGAGADATVLRLLPPLARYLSEDTDRGERINEGSLGVRIERGEFSFLTTGDGEAEANRRFARAFPDEVDVTVLKLGHHGSTDATQPFWLDATSPEVAIVSANGTTHPHAAALRMVRGRGIALLCTPQHGRITVLVASGGRYDVVTERAATVRCRPGSER